MARARHLLASIGVALALGLGIAACGSNGPASPRCPTDSAGLLTCKLTYKDLTTHAEATLYYPGARILRHTGGDEQSGGVEGEPSSAFAGAIMATADSPQQVYAWYATYLQAHGWSPARVGTTEAWLSVQGYKRGTREHFDVAIDNPAVLGRLINQQLPSAQTVMEFSYLVAPAASSSS